MIEKDKKQRSIYYSILKRQPSEDVLAVTVEQIHSIYLRMVEFTHVH